MQQFSATVPVTWFVNGTQGGNATVGTITAGGLYTAPNALPSPNTVTVTAISVADTTKSGSAMVTLLNPIPVISSVSPNPLPVGPFTLSVSGTKFVSGAQVNFGGTALQTTFVSAMQLTATGTATPAQANTNVCVTVTNPNPGSATSLPECVPVTNVTGGGSGSTAILGNKAYVPIKNLEQIAVINVDSKTSTGAVIATIPMPAGYSPSATAANPVTKQVVVISFDSPDVQIIDAIQDKLIPPTLTSPVTLRAFFSGGGCLICGVLVDSLMNKAILDTGQGPLLLDLVTGAFSQFLPAGAPAAAAENFAFNPNTDPNLPHTRIALLPTYSVSAFVGLQALRLADNSLSRYTDSVGVGTRPDSAAVDFTTNIVVIPDESTGEQHLINMKDAFFSPGSPGSFTAPHRVFPINFTGCGRGMEMVSVESSSHLLFLATEFDNCAAVETLPTAMLTGAPPLPAVFRWGHMPATLDGFTWVNAGDPHGIAVFTSVLDGKAYGFVVNDAQTWVARIDLAAVRDATLKVGGGPNEVDLTPFAFFLKTQ